jgi:N-acetylmuramoyl-L-alanine amidase
MFTKKFLTVNPYSRSGRRLSFCKAIIFHSTGVPGQRAQTVWNYFEKCCPREKRHASYHFIIDLDGEIFETIPVNEVAFHCGTNRKDPVSGKVYTDWAREKFGRFAADPKNNSPNNCTIGIGLCIDRQGNFTMDTINSAIDMALMLQRQKKLTTDDIGTHKQVVGWKDCPLPWIREPELFDEFIDRSTWVTVKT